MFKVREITNYLINRFPIENQEPWDNCGVLFDFNNDCSKIVIGLDVTIDLIQEAINKQANLIITHHPIYLNQPDTPISPDKQRLIDLLKKHQINHLALHTCFDKDIYGTSFQIITKLPLVSNCYQLNECPYVFVANLSKPICLNEFVNNCNFKPFSYQPIIYDKSFANKTISKIALCAGTGSFFVPEILKNPIVDCYLCGDIKWHNWIDAHDCQFPLIDISHATEAVFIDAIDEILQKNFNLETIKVYPNLNLVVHN